MTRPGAPGTAAPQFFGVVVAFVVAVRLVQTIGPGLLLDPDPGWAIPRAVLWVFLSSAVASAGAVAAAVFLLWSRSRLGRLELRPLELRRETLVALTGAALAAGLFLRVVWIGSLPFPFLGDEVNLIGPTLALTGTWRDFADSIRPMPHGVADPHEMIGVLYLRLFRESLAAFGATVSGVRFLSFAGGALSLLTGTLLARVLLPRGAATLAALVLAGLRWHLILSRNGWHSIVLVPLIDLAAVGLIAARRRGRILPAFAAGALIGIGAHFYLAAWIAGAALLAYSVWPPAPRDDGRARARRLLSYAAGFVLTAAPLFVFRQGRAHEYFERGARHNVIAEMRYTKSVLPPFAVAADALIAPWLLPDPERWCDLPGRVRLGWIIGIPVAVAFARALLRPRDEPSGLLILHAGAAFAAAIAGGRAGHPNGFRFGYLTTLTAVAAAAGCLQLVRLSPKRFRRAAAVVCIGLFAASGAAGARDAILRWPEHRSTFDWFHGQDTLIGRAAARWETYGSVGVEPRLGRSDATIETVRRYRLDPEKGPISASPRVPRSGSSPIRREFRVVGPGNQPLPGERLVERVQDGWSREWAVVLAGLRRP